MENLKIVGAEVWAVLKNIPNREFEKVPKKIRDVFEKYNDEEINKKIDLDKSWQEQDIREETRNVIFLLTYNYWVNAEEKKQITQCLKDNERAYIEKYDVSNMFKQEEKVSNVENTALVELKEEGILKRIINKIKKFFSRK